MKSSDFHWVEELMGSQYIHWERVQELWSGYGQIIRLYFEDNTSVIVKEIDYSGGSDHPRGWSSKVSDNRKRKSYEVELNWYKGQARQLDEMTKIPTLLGVKKNKKTSFILEDLNALGYNQRLSTLDLEGAQSCLKWLARFHATFLGAEPIGLWPIGTYWHLHTRPDEFNRMEDSWLKTNASRIDSALNNSTYRTFVHGDAKVANFCFGQNRSNVAALDFQYVGGGCGMKDVAYFISSCLESDDAAKWESQLLDTYFKELKSRVPDVEFRKLESEWRALYPVAWADFVRFLLGWAPDHYKLNEYSLLQVEKAKKYF